MDPLTETFSRNLRALRIALNVTQRAFADRAGFSVAYVSMLERAERSPPFSTLLKIAEALQVQPAYLLQDLDVPEPEMARRVARGRARRRPQ